MTPPPPAPAPHHHDLLLQTECPALTLIARGKVRDIYRVDDDTLLFVATDRLSAFDVVMKNVRWLAGGGGVVVGHSLADLLSWCHSYCWMTVQPHRDTTIINHHRPPTTGHPRQGQDPDAAERVLVPAVGRRTTQPLDHPGHS